MSANRLMPGGRRHPTIVIAGAGYGGLAAARTLKHHTRDLRVILLDQNSYHLLQFQLHEAAAGKIDATTLALPIHALLPARVEFKQTRIQGFDFDNQLVKTDTGDITYERLIIALGGQPALVDIPGLSKHAFMLKSLPDARHIYEHTENILAQAAQSPDGHSAALTFVVGGGGITGVELAAELAEGLVERAREYGIDQSALRIVLVEAAQTILQGFDGETIAEATVSLKQLGVDVRVNSAVTQIDAARVTLQNGETIDTHTFIWTGGVRANQLVLDSGLTLDGRGAALVDHFLRSVDHSNVSIIGDSALIRDPRHGGSVMPCAQLAMKQGQYAAKDIIAELESDVRHMYVPRLQGMLISLGGRRGVGTIGPMWVRRLLARLGKIGAETRYLMSIGGLRLLFSRWLLLRAEWVRFTK